MPKRKVMIIGMDAAPLDLVRPWAAEGRLPNLARFLSEGAAGLLRTTIPPQSPAAWSTFATGTNPGKHGILNFVQLGPDSYSPRFVNAAHRRGATFWEIAGQQGIRGGIINVPITYPPRDYNGFIISGMLSPGTNAEMARPPEILEDLKAFSPNYAIEVESAHTGGAIGSDQDVRARFYDEVLSVLKARLDAAVGLYRKHKPPLFCIVFIAADRICHYFWRYMEAAKSAKPLGEMEHRFSLAIQTVYEKLDEAIGALLEAAGEETDVVIMSDHGSGAFRKGLNLGKVLAREGLLTEATPSLFNRVRKRLLWSFVRMTPWRMQCKIKSLLPALSRYAAGVVTSSDIDFSRTLAYPAGPVGGVFVNLKGRQPKGSVESSEHYEQIRTQIIDVFSRLTDPETGEKIARKVHRREEIWRGACLDQLPDVVIEQEDDLYHTPAATEGHSDDVFYDIPDSGPDRMYRNGVHRREGLLMAMGPHIRCTQIHGANIVDVPATILALLGCSIPDNFDGRVLTEMLTDDVPIPERVASEGTAPQQRGVYTEEEQAALKRRLKGLGYM